MKYVILIYRNPKARAAWQEMSATQRQEGLEVYRRLQADLEESGEMVASTPLADAEAGTRLPATEGMDFTDFATDGPFAETTEYVGGFIMVDVDSEERALEIAARVPEAPLGLVEVRPTLDLAAFDL